MVLSPLEVRLEKVVGRVDVRPAFHEEVPGVQRVLADAVALLRRLSFSPVKGKAPQQCQPAVV
jgi:hypothetical protein